MRSQIEDDINDVSSMFVQHEPVDVDCSVDPITGEDCPSKTREEFAAECDINNILARYENTGVISHINPRQPVYLDASNVPDLREALAAVRTAEEAFMSLPAVVRAEFDNDAVAWHDYAVDPKNKDQMIKWGLAKAPEPPPAPMKVEVVNPPPVSPPADG